MNSLFNKKNKIENTTYDDISSLSHTKWNCKYHIVFTPKYRRKIFYNQKRIEIGKILRELCEWQEVKIIEAEVCPDHIHMFVSIPPKLSVSKFMGILKGKSSLIIFQRWSNLKYKFGQLCFWCRDYYVDTVGKNAKRIAEYVRNQLKEDMMSDQMTIKEYKDPFNGS
jgi:putative transposase